ncbi:unnamed protein product [Urochloa humidicola]
MGPLTSPLLYSMLDKEIVPSCSDEVSVAVQIGNHARGVQTLSPTFALQTRGVQALAFLTDLRCPDQGCRVQKRDHKSHGWIAHYQCQSSSH